MLYTPFLPEAAAGTLEPRHVVTPLRDILKRTNLRLGAIAGHDPAARTVELHTHDGEVEELRYDQLMVAVGSVSRSLPIPGLDKHAIGFKSLADAIWLRNHLVETLEQANATDDPARREELLTYVFVGGGYSGLEALAELQDFAADAMDRYPRARLHGMRWILIEAMDRVLPEVPQDLADYAVAQLRGRGIDIRLGTRIEEAAADSVLLSTGERVPTRTLVWTAGVKPHPSLAAMAVPLNETGRVRRRPARCASRACAASGRSATAPRCRIPTAAAALSADRGDGRAPGAGGRPQRRLRARRVDHAAELQLSRARGLREPRPLQGCRQGRPRSSSAASSPGGWRAATT